MVLLLFLRVYLRYDVNLFPKSWKKRNSSQLVIAFQFQLCRNTKDSVQYPYENFESFSLRHNSGAGRRRTLRNSIKKSLAAHIRHNPHMSLRSLASNRVGDVSHAAVRMSLKDTVCQLII